jgi:hypothetical protein
MEELRRRPPLWVPIAGLIVGPLLAIAIVAVWVLAALLQHIADCWEGSQM